MKTRKMRKTTPSLLSGSHRKMKSNSLLNPLSLFRSVLILRARFMLLDGYSGERKMGIVFLSRKIPTGARYIRFALCSAALIPFILKD